MNWLVTTILVPSDGSTAAEPQLASARALARATGARVVVAHVNEIVRGRMAAHSVHASEDELVATVREQAEELRSAGVRAEAEIVSSTAELAQAIADLAKRRQADLIVTRKSRGGAVLGALSGGVSRRLLRLAPCPVLVVS